MNTIIKIYQKITCLVYVFFFAALWLPWMEIGNKSYHLPGYLRMVQKAGGIVAMTDGSPDFVASYYLFFIPVLAGILAVIYAVSLLAGRPFKVLYTMVRWCEFIYVAAAVILFPMVPLLWTYILPLLCLAEYVAGQYVAQHDEIAKAARERMERDRREKEERKRRLYFPGRYGIDFFRMVLKNAKYHIRNYIMLILSGTFLMLFLYLTFALKYAFQGVHTEEAVVGGRLQGILLEAVWIGLVLNAVLMALSFSYYIRNKIKEENALVLLGIRSRALTSIMVMEYTGCLACSAVMGILMGNIAFRILISALGKRLPVRACSLPVSSYLILIGIFAVAALIAAMVNGHVYEHMRWEQAGLLVTGTGEIPGISVWIGLAVGCYAIFSAVSQFGRREGGEGEELLLYFLFGMVLVIRFLKGVQVQRLKKTEHRYYRELFRKLIFIKSFGQNMKKIYLLTGIAFLVMYPLTAVYAVNAAVTDMEQQYPYDFVCRVSEEGTDAFEEIRDRYKLDAEEYPMTTVYTLMPNDISVTSSLKSLFFMEYASVANGRQVLVEPPAQAGIPASVYLKLKENAGKKVKARGPEGEDIFVVYQESLLTRAHVLDWSGTEESIFLQTACEGMDVNSYSAYTERRVAGQERDILTGVCDGGKQQNLVVFSDEYFQTIYQGEKLYLFQAGTAEKGFYEKVRAELQKAEEDTGMLHFYDRKASVQDTETERYLRQVVWLFMLILTGLSGIYLLFIKFCFEMDEITERYRFLSCMGMREREVRKTLQREMLPFFLLPFFAAGASAVMFTGLMFRVRLYSPSEMGQYLRYALPVWCGYWLIQAIVCLIIRGVLHSKIRFEQGGVR